MELFNIDHLRKPHWTGRNKLIADHFLESNKSVLDIGCGAKDLLRYYKPSSYLGVDGIEQADLVIDLNSDFKIPGGWDYVVCSGIFEHVDRADLLLKKLLNLGNEYIFTWWSSPGFGRLTHSRMEDLIRENYSIISEENWGPVQKVYKCIPYQAI